MLPIAHLFCKRWGLSEGNKRVSSTILNPGGLTRCYFWTINPSSLIELLPDPCITYRIPCPCPLLSGPKVCLISYRLFYFAMVVAVILLFWGAHLVLFGDHKPIFRHMWGCLVPGINFRASHILALCSAT